MHDGMQYDPIQGQGHEPFKVGNPAIFKSYLLCHLHTYIRDFYIAHMNSIESHLTMGVGN